LKPVLRGYIIKPPPSTTSARCCSTRGGWHPPRPGVFRRLCRGDTLTDQRLSDQSVALIVKRRARTAGVSAAELSGHSLRAGYATAAAAAGVEERKIANVTRPQEPPRAAPLHPHRDGVRRRWRRALIPGTRRSEPLRSPRGPDTAGSAYANRASRRPPGCETSWRAGGGHTRSAPGGRDVSPRPSTHRTPHRPSSPRRPRRARSTKRDRRRSPARSSSCRTPARQAQHADRCRRPCLRALLPPGVSARRGPWGTMEREVPLSHRLGRQLAVRKRRGAAASRAFCLRSWASRPVKRPRCAARFARPGRAAVDCSLRFADGAVMVAAGRDLRQWATVPEC
jgi:hypothetical protein